MVRAMNLALGLVAVLLTGATPKFTGYTAKSDPFRVDFPGAPKLETSKDKGMVTRTYTLDSDFAVYMVMVIADGDIKPENAKDEFEGFREAEKSDAKILSEKAVSFGSAPGIELKLQGKELDSLARMYVMKGRSLTVIVDVDHGHTFAEAGVDQFFSSFAITDKSVGAPTPVAQATAAPAPAPAKPAAKSGTMSKDGVDVFGFTPDGSKVVAIEHGVYDGKGTAWGRITFFDTAKASVIGKPIEFELESADQTEEDAFAEAKTRAEAERVRLKLPALVPGKSINTNEKGELTEKEGAPIGNLEVKLARGKSVRECMDPFKAELLTAKLYLMGGDEKPTVVIKETKTPATRACTMGCAPSKTYGQGKGALFVLSCNTKGFEGPATQAMLLPLGKLEYPLDGELPPQ